MTIYSWLNTPVRPPAEMTRDRVTPEARMVSVFNQALQSSERAGQHWRLELTWRLYGEERDALEALLTLLNGTEHRLALPMFDLSTGVKPNRGTFSGTPVVDGAGQTGYQIIVRGGGASDTSFALPGDFLKFDNCIRMVTEKTETDGTGDAVISVWPQIRTSPGDGEPIVTTPSMEGVYYLESMPQMPIEDTLARGEVFSTISASFVDDVLA